MEWRDMDKIEPIPTLRKLFLRHFQLFSTKRRRLVPCAAGKGHGTVSSLEVNKISNRPKKTADFLPATVVCSTVSMLEATGCGNSTNDKRKDCPCAAKIDHC